MFNPRTFVDREPQLSAFECRLNGTDQSSVLLFRGPLGMGKTSILYRLSQVCQGANVRCALVDLQSEEMLGPETVIDQLAEELKGVFYEAITAEKAALERDFPNTSPKERVRAAMGGALALPGFNGPGSAGPPPGPPVLVEIDGRIDQVAAGGMAAIGQGIVQTQVTINNPIIASPEMVYRLVPEERLRRLSFTTRKALEALAAQGLLVLMFDACDAAAAGVIPWLRKQILEPLLYGHIASAGNLAVVMVGDEQCEKGAWLKEFVDFGEGVATYLLDNLPPEAVVKYWIEIRGLPKGNLPAVFENGAPPYLLVQMANFTKGLSDVKR